MGGDVLENNAKISADIILKKYWENKKRFADLFNAFLFNGEEVIRSNDLEYEPTEVSNHVETKNQVVALPRFRDVLMHYHGIGLAILGIENQYKVHYAMPLRKLLYDGLSYQKQCDRIAEEHREKKDLNSREFLSHIGKNDRLQPVITIVIYYGEDVWDGAKSLYDMLDIPERMKPFVSDYKMNLIEVRKNNLLFHDKDNKDLFTLFDILYNKNCSIKERREKAVKYDSGNHMDKDVLMALAATADTANLSYYKTIIENRAERSDIVCEVFEAIRQEGRQDGQAQQIVRMSMKYHAAQESILSELVTELEITMEQAKEYLNLYGKQR
jgi:hypothetical protein